MATSLLLKQSVSDVHLFDGLAPASTSRSRPYIGSPWNSLWKSRRVERKQWLKRFRYLLEVRFGFSRVVTQRQAQLISSARSPLFKISQNPEPPAPSRPPLRYGTSVPLLRSSILSPFPFAYALKYSSSYFFPRELSRSQ